MSDNHDHDHEEDQLSHEGLKIHVEMSEQAKRITAIQELLEERGIIEDGEVQEIIDFINARSPADGARVVARAWISPAFKRRLLANPEEAIEELGFRLQHSTQLVVAENTEKVHHIVVCTLCSCYPSSLLGAPPDWYKSLAYRSRAVVDPRGVMKEFGLELPDDVEVKVLDSTADIRYLVLPLQPPGTEDMIEEELAKLVTRDSMIGVSNPRTPNTIPASA